MRQVFLVGIAALVLSPLISFAQKDSTDRGRITLIETGIGLGGNLYLNFIDFNPIKSVRVGHGVKVTDRWSTLIVSGVDFLDDETFVPILLRSKFDFNRQYIFWEIGYGIGFFAPDFEYKEYDFDGGLMTSLGYGVKVYEKNGHSLDLFAAYQLRRARLTFEPEDTQGTLTSRFNFNHIFLGTAFYF